MENNNTFLFEAIEDATRQHISDMMIDVTESNEISKNDQIRFAKATKASIIGYLKLWYVSDDDKTLYADCLVTVWNKDTINPRNIERPLIEVFEEYADEIISHITRKTASYNARNKLFNICDYVKYLFSVMVEKDNNDIIDNNEEIIDKIDRIDADLYNMSIATIKMYRDLMRSISEEIEDIRDSEELTKNELESFKKLAEVVADLIYKIDQLIHFENDEQAETVQKIARIKYPKEYEYIDEVHGAAMERFRKLYDLL